jgi:hypothetical protein
VLINQIIGFIGFQARVVAVFQALLGHPYAGCRDIISSPIRCPSMPARGCLFCLLLNCAMPTLISWVPFPAGSQTLELTPVLCHEPALLDLTGEILINSREDESPTLLALSAAVALLTHSPDRFSAAQFTPLTDEGLPAVRAINLLTQSAFEAGSNALASPLAKRNNRTNYPKSACCDSENRVKLSAAQWLRK